MIEINQITVGCNKPKFSEIFSCANPLLDKQGHPRSFELTLDKGMIGHILNEEEESFLIKFSFYPKPIYIFKKHCSPYTEEKIFPSYTLNQILERLKSCLGKPYLWGGNSFFSTDAFKNFFFFQIMEKKEKRAVCLDGLDCSGLLFFATGYKTPRNTYELQKFGFTVKDSTSVKPLDLILTCGHVAIIIDSNYVIQSKQNRGVYITRLKEELLKLYRTKKQVDEVKTKDEFSLRRFYF